MSTPQQAVPTTLSITSGHSGLVHSHGGQLLTTTSAIAVGTANTHEAVIRLVRGYQADLEEFGGVRFEIECFATAGGPQKREIAFLNEEQAILLITYMRNNVIVRRFKIALVRDFSDMRRCLATSATPNFADEIEAGEAWLAAKKEARAYAARAELEAEKVKELEHQVTEQAPAVAGFNRIANADGAMCITDAAKSLQLQPHKLRDVLLEMKWMYRRQGKGGYVAYQDRIHAGHLKHKVGNYQDPETGENKTNPQVLVTSKGLAQLSKLLGPQIPPPAKPAWSVNKLN